MIFYCQSHPKYDGIKLPRSKNCYDCHLFHDLKYLERLMIGARDAARGANQAASTALYVANQPVMGRRY